jgi:hypothetical protein
MKKKPIKITTSGWNYRVVKMADEVKLKGFPKSYSYGIYEVYYDKKGKPIGWSSDPMWPIGEDLAELLGDFDYMHQAFSRPILELRGNKLIASKIKE